MSVATRQTGPAPVSTADQARIAETTERGYTFHSNLQDSAPIHMNGRVMDAELGRFLSASPCYGGATTKSAVDVVFEVLSGPCVLFLSV